MAHGQWPRAALASAGHWLHDECHSGRHRNNEGAVVEAHTLGAASDAGTGVGVAPGLVSPELAGGDEDRHHSVECGLGDLETPCEVRGADRTLCCPQFGEEVVEDCHPNTADPIWNTATAITQARAVCPMIDVHIHLVPISPLMAPTAAMHGV